jgi:cytosine/creatinine deaminase
LSSLPAPASNTFVLANVTVPAITAPGLKGAACEGLITTDVFVRDGTVESFTAPLDDYERIDLTGGMVWPCFVDMHTHIDKGHIWPRAPNPDGSFMGALQTVHEDRIARWTAQDVATRMDFSLRCAFTHGTKLLRTHLDSLAPQHRISFAVFEEMKETWKGRIDLQAAALFSLDDIMDEKYFSDLVTTVKNASGVLGGIGLVGPNLKAQLDILFRAASENGLDIDLHVDESSDPDARTLMAIADASLRHRFEGAVTVGHCCSLAVQDRDYASEVIAKVAEAKLSVVSLPLCNLYLQDRNAGRTPRWRGVTLFQELAAAGVPTAVASDNTRDPFYAYGDLDPVEVFRESVRILHLDHPLDTAARIITTTPADILKRPDIGRIAIGAPADLVMFRARNWSEFLSRPQSDRLVLRDGKVISPTLPDYRELDPLWST